MTNPKKAKCPKEIIGECVITRRDLMEDYPVKVIIVDLLCKAGFPLPICLSDGISPSDPVKDMKRINAALKEVGADELTVHSDFECNMTYRWFKHHNKRHEVRS